MALYICHLLGALYILLSRHSTAQSTTSLLPSHENAELWVADDAQGSAFLQTTSSLGTTPSIDKTLSIRLKLPTPTSVNQEAEGFVDIKPVLETQLEMLPLNTSEAETPKTTSSSALLPAVTVAELGTSHNTTSTSTSAQNLASRSSTSIMTIKQQATTIYVAQITSTTSQTLEAQATGSESFLRRTGVTTPGSSANIAAIGLGAGCGAIVLVVVSVIAVWLLHRHRGSSVKAFGRDSDFKLERQG
jgi:hypothetical protein